MAHDIVYDVLRAMHARESTRHAESSHASTTSGMPIALRVSTPTSNKLLARATVRHSLRFFLFCVYLPYKIAIVGDFPVGSWQTQTDSGGKSKIVAIKPAETVPAVPSSISTSDLFLDLSPSRLDWQEATGRR